MDTTKQLTVDQIQGYLVRGVALLPNLYEHLLVQLESMVREKKACMLPVSIFDLYHIRLKKRLICRIETYKARTAARKAA